MYVTPPWKLSTMWLFTCSMLSYILRLIYHSLKQGEPFSVFWGFWGFGVCVCVCGWSSFLEFITAFVWRLELHPKTHECILLDKPSPIVSSNMCLFLMKYYFLFSYLGWVIILRSLIKISCQLMLSELQTNYLETYCLKNIKLMLNNSANGVFSPQEISLIITIEYYFSTPLLF